MTVALGLTDFVPVILFLITAILLQQSLYNKMSKGAFALFACGTIMTVVAGTYKATWKILYCAGICDFRLLSQQFMPLQATGFFFTAIGIIAMLVHKQSKAGEKIYAAAAAPAVYTGTMIFVAMMCLGIGALCACLSVLAAKLKKKGLIPLFLVTFILMLGMGYLSSKDFEDPKMNWIAEGVNILGQGCLLLGTILLRKAGLTELRLKTA